jgi:cytochrome c oxidase assembly factor CtaG
MSAVGPVVLALGYLAAARRTPWPARRAVAFLAGCAALCAAGFVGDRTLPAHMAEHIVLTMIATPLLLAGAPVRLALRTLPPGGPRGRAGRALHALRLVFSPPVAFALFAATILATHLTPFFDAAARHAGLHALEHALYLTTALLFWAPIVGADPVPRVGWLGRTLMLLGSMPAMSFVGVLLEQAASPRYSSYPSLPEQRTAGALMWVGSSAIAAAFAIVLGWQALAREEHEQRARERQALRPARLEAPPR